MPSQNIFCQADDAVVPTITDICKFGPEPYQEKAVVYSLQLFEISAERFLELTRCSPPILALKATPTPHTPLLAAAATSPAHRVPCLPKHKRKRSQTQKAVSE